MLSKKLHIMNLFLLLGLLTNNILVLLHQQEKCVHNYGNYV